MLIARGGELMPFACRFLVCFSVILAGGKLPRQQSLGKGDGYFLRRRPGTGSKEILSIAQPPHFLHDVTQPLALDELHGVVMNALVFADTEDRDDVGMVKLRRCTRLTPEAFQVRRVQQAIEGQHFQRHMPTQRLLHCFVHHPHAAAPDLAQDAIFP